MGKVNGQGMEALAVRRATRVDADKVRYRVYRSPQDFIAVIAENALMAVKVSGVEEPYRIVRDLPTEGVAIQAERMVERTENPAQVNFAMSRVERTTQVAPRDEAAHAPNFIPMQIRDLEKRGTKRTRIVSPAELEAMMEASRKVAPPPIEIEVPKLMEEAEEVIAEPLPEPRTEGELSPEEVEALLK